MWLSVARSGSTVAFGKRSVARGGPEWLVMCVLCVFFNVMSFSHGVMGATEVQLGVS